MSILELVNDAEAERVKSLVLRRLLLGGQRGSLVPAKVTLSPKAAREAKLALLLVRQVNPCEYLTQLECALLEGVNVKTLALRQYQKRKL